MNFQSVTARLMAPLMASMLLLAVLAGVTLHLESRVATANAEAMTAQRLVAEFGEVRSLSRSLQRDALNLIVETDAEERSAIRKKFTGRAEKFGKALDDLKVEPGQAGVEPAFFETQKNVADELTAVVERADRGDLAGATEDFRHGVRPAERAASKIADERIEALGQEVHALRASAAAVTRQGQILLIVATVILAFAGLAAGFLITRRSVVRPLHDLRAGMAALAAGNTGLAIPHVGRADEVGQMAESMAIFRDQLAAAEKAKEVQTALIVDSIGNGLDALARGDLSTRVEAGLTGPFAKLESDFNRAVGELGSAMRAVTTATHNINTGAGEIRQASNDLAHRTEAQAAQNEETAAAMAQITTAVRETANGASRAGAMIGETRVEAEQSSEVVRRAVSAMGDIEKSSSEISEIIAVIDGIAYQTNLLALNAGVEAARAGEAGKGFAVVATEVRALAQRSADAATDVKARITASTAQVDNGVALVLETGRTLERIVERVSEVSALVTTIADAAERQASTLQQVNTAVSGIDLVTQQNAAMVEEATAAASSLAGEADALAREVAHFRLGDEKRAHRAPAASADPQLRARAA